MSLLLTAVALRVGPGTEQLCVADLRRVRYGCEGVPAGHEDLRLADQPAWSGAGSGEASGRDGGGTVDVRRQQLPFLQVGARVACTPQLCGGAPAAAELPRGHLPRRQQHAMPI